MTRKGEYAILHTTRRAISHPGGITESHTWSCVRAVHCTRDGHVKDYLEGPGRYSLRVVSDVERAFFEIPSHPYAQGLAARLFKASATFPTASDLKKAICTDIPSIRRFI